MNKFFTISKLRRMFLVKANPSINISLYNISLVENKRGYDAINISGVILSVLGQKL